MSGITRIFYYYFFLFLSFPISFDNLLRGDNFFLKKKKSVDNIWYNKFLTLYSYLKLIHSPISNLLFEIVGIVNFFSQ